MTMAKSILDQFRLDGQAALVIGGNRGLGLEMAKALAEAGASLFLAGRDAARNEQARAPIANEYGRECGTAECDVTDPGQVAATVAAAVAQFGKIDVLINSAGINIRGAIEDVSPEDFEQGTAGERDGYLADVPRGRAGDEAQRLRPDRQHRFDARRGGDPGADALRDEQGRRAADDAGAGDRAAREKITANAILPGPFATEMNLPLTKDPEKYPAFMAKIPMGRWGELHRDRRAGAVPGQPGVELRDRSGLHDRRRLDRTVVGAFDATGSTDS